MMKVFTANQIRAWDAYTILHEPITEIALVDRVASACYQWIAKDLPLLEKEAAAKNRSLKIFCGKGNNGADGLAIARLCLQDGIATEVYILESKNTGSSAFEHQLQALQRLNLKPTSLNSPEEFPAINNTDIVIDALFGTGLNKPLAGPGALLVQHINYSQATVIAIDIPSGLYADESSRTALTIKANYTLSFQCYKLAFLMPENEMSLGKLFILDIGLHPQFEANEKTNFALLDDFFVKKIFRARSRFAHKGDFGHAIITAGSYGKMGAAVLAANACLRSGVGLLTMQVPAVGYDIIQNTAPEAMAITENLQDYQSYHVAGIGPGLGTSAEAIKKTSDLLDQAPNLKHFKINDACCLVVDADALNIFSQYPSMLQNLPANSILTPHPKEFERLFGETTNDFERLQLALDKARDLNYFIILKGHHTLIACPDGTAWFNNTGNAGMATGGTGDVLTGILTGLAAQGYSAKETCLLGVYLHGLAGDLAAEALSEESMVAGDIIQYLGQAFKHFNRENAQVNTKKC